MPRAGLAPASVVLAGAALADEVGFARLSMGLLADRLGVKTPSLYKHVDGLADLTSRIAALAMTELADAVSGATQGRAGREALGAAAQALRTWVTDHPGRYDAGNAARPAGPDDPLLAASGRLLAALSAVLRGYDLAPGQEVHALRALRSALHGFVVLEASGGFMLDTDVDASFTWLVDRLDAGMRSAASSVDAPDGLAG